MIPLTSGPGRGPRDASGAPHEAPTGGSQPSDRRLLLGIAVAAVVVLIVLLAGLYVGGVFGSDSAGSSASEANATALPHHPDVLPGSTTTVTSTSTTTTPPANPTPTGPTGAPINQSYTGTAFSVSYPSGWGVQGAEVSKPWGSDTTIVSPDDSNTLIRVDVTPNESARSPLASAQPVISALEQQPGYKQLDLSAGTFDGYPAEHWEFEVRESGILLHKEDEFFIDGSGNGVAVLTQAPAGTYSTLAPGFASVRRSLTMN